MKFNVTFKDPDTLSQAICDAVDIELEKLNLSEDEFDAIRQIRIEKIESKLGKWFQYLEYVTVEIDTDKDTVKVIPNE